MIGPRTKAFLNHSGQSRAPRRSMLTILTTLVLLAAPVISLTTAGEATAESLFGCDVSALPPVIENGEVVGKAEVECQTERDGREIATEVWQRDNSGIWHAIDDSITTWEGSDRILPLHHPDTTGIDCMELTGGEARLYRTRIVVSNAAGDSSDVVSQSAVLFRDCLGGAGIGTTPPLPPPQGVQAAGSSGGITCGIIPSVPVRQGGDLKAKTFFDCIALRPGEVRYLRVRLVEDTPLFFDKVIRSRAFADRCGLDRSFNLIASCNDKDSGTVTYYNASRETFELPNGSQPYGPGTAEGGDRDIKARCKR